MNRKTAQLLLGVFNLLAIVAVIYVINDYLRVTDAIHQKHTEIDFDSGIYYLLLMSVFWPITAVEFIGLVNAQHRLVQHSQVVIIAWFIVMLILSHIIPYQLTHKMQGAGYIAYDDPAEISRVSKGESLIYKLNH